MNPSASSKLRATEKPSAKATVASRWAPTAAGVGLVISKSL